MAADSGSLHSLPAYSYLAKPFEPPGGQALGRSKPSLQPRASRDAASEGSSSPHTPPHADLAAPEGPAMPLSAPNAAGASPPTGLAAVGLGHAVALSASGSSCHLAQHSTPSHSSLQGTI